MSIRLVLASASPRRAELLTTAGYTFEVRAVDVDERVLPREPPSSYVQRLAAEKSARALEEILEGPAKAGPHDRYGRRPGRPRLRQRQSKLSSSAQPTWDLPYGALQEKFAASSMLPAPL